MSWIYRKYPDSWIVGFLTITNYLEPVLKFPMGTQGEEEAQAMCSYLNGGKHPVLLKREMEGWMTRNQPRPKLWGQGMTKTSMYGYLYRFYPGLDDEALEAIEDAVENFSLDSEFLHIMQGQTPTFWRDVMGAIKESTYRKKPTLLDCDLDDP
jgi:hypothetical protein